MTAFSTIPVHDIVLGLTAYALGLILFLFVGVQNIDSNGRPGRWVGIAQSVYLWGPVWLLGALLLPALRTWLLVALVVCLALCIVGSLIAFRVDRLRDERE
ncbi:hypothetical protein [Streptomyces sp. NPDC052042]|uniref:hypothetical protein n=1 Tax=Streptomyces sp. NPDC052042 TaxID=3365683 RepID=UPI0037D00BCC